MSKRAVQAIIGKAVTDSRFRNALFANPDAVLGGYDLTDGEIAALKAIVAAASPTASEVTTTQQPRPMRRLALQPSATIVGNMAVRKRLVDDGVELSWDTASNVTEWTIRVSVRPDPRQDYVEGDLLTLAPATVRIDVALDELPRRIQLYGLARDGRIVRRAIISALTSGNSGAQWKRQATAS